MNTVWVLTYEVNAYDQEGAYFAEVFKERPSAEALTLVLIDHNYIEKYWTKEYQNEVAQRIISGVGRKSDEHRWFTLEEVNLK